MDEKDLTVEQEKVIVKPKRGRPAKADTPLKVTVGSPVVEETKAAEIVVEEIEAVKELKKVDKPKEVNPCDDCEYTYGSMPCGHGCIHFKKK